MPIELVIGKIIRLAQIFRPVRASVWRREN